MNRSRVPLKKFVNEYSVRNKANEDIPVYSVTNSQGFCTEYFGKEVASQDKTTYKIVPRGYFAYNPSRINVGSVDWQRCEDRVIVSPLYTVFSVSDEIDCQYLYYFLRSDFGKQMIKARASGSVRDNLKLEMLKEMTIPDISKEEQHFCAQILDRLQILIQLQKQELQKLDDLIKARFAELFGNCKNQVSLSDLCSIITDGTHQPPKFQETGIPFILVSNLSNNTVTYNTEKYIDEETYNELYKRTPVEIGDLLLSTVGSYGHPAVVTEATRFLFQRHIAYLKPKKEVVNSLYLHSALLTPEGQRQIEEKVKGIAQKTLNLSEIRKIMVPVPEMKEQNEFVEFVERVNKSEFSKMQTTPRIGFWLDNSNQTPQQTAENILNARKPV